MLVDSGSNIHFLTLEDARNYFMSRRSTQLRVLGINGVRERCKAEGEIEMLVRDHLGKQLNLSLGTGYTSGKIPKSLLSASRLMASGAILHFEKGASYMELPRFKSRIDLVEKNGLFYIPTDKVAEIEVLDVDMENVDAVAGEASSAYSAASTESWTFSANATSAEALREEHELAQEYMAKEHAMALAAEVAVMVANSHCDAENDQEHHAAIKAVTAALADGPSADDRRQQMNELVEARAKKFIKLAKENDFEIVYLQNNPKVKGDAKKFSEGKTSWKLYERFKKGTTIKGAMELGATMDRINDDYEHGYIRFPGRESREPEHVFLADGEKASDLASLLGIDYDMGLSNTGEFEDALKGAEEAAKKAEEKLRKNFNEVIATCYDPEMAVKIVEEKKYRDMFAEHHGLRLMCTSSAVNYADIDYTLSPEPDYKGSLEENGCLEWSQWEHAREEELAAMRKFGVYRVVKRHEARGHKLLTSKWVHKRKTDQWGKVNRHKARLVARGFAQREYDSYHPDEVFAHVVDKNSLRALLSYAASEDLKVYSFDVSKRP